MIKNTTHLNKDQFAYIAKLNTKAPVVIIVRAIFLAVGCLFAWIAFNNFGTARGNCFSVLCLACVIISFWAVPAMLKAKIMKVSPAEGVRTYEFGPDELTVFIPVGDREAWNKMPYDAISTAFVTDDTLYLQAKKNASYLIVDKAGFTSGNAEELVKLLKEKGVRIE